MSDFLDGDHTISLDLVVRLINAEVQWCYQNPMPDEVSQQFQVGFIQGLLQSKRLIVNVARKIYEEHKR